MRKPKKSGKTTSLMDAHFLNKAECLLARQRDLWSVNMDQGKACCAGPAESGARGRKSSGPTAAQGPMGDTARWLSRTPPAGRTHGGELWDSELHRRRSSRGYGSIWETRL